MHPNKCLFGVGHVLGAIGILYSVIILLQSFYNLLLDNKKFHQLNIVIFVFISLALFIYVMCNISLILGIQKRNSKLISPMIIFLTICLILCAFRSVNAYKEKPFLRNIRELMYVSACLTIIYKIREVILDLEESLQIPIIEVTEEVHVDVVDDNGAEITAV